MAAPLDKTLGIDCSHWSGQMNWQIAKDKGVKWMMNKVSDVGSSTGMPFYDDTADVNYAGAKALGILTGGYCWLDPFYNADAQAEFYLKWYRTHPTDLPPVVDFEDDAVIDKNDYLYKLQRWLQVVEKETGRKPIIYTAKWFMDKFDITKTTWMSAYPLHVAHYISRSYPALPREWKEYAIWQYSDKGHYPYHDWTKSLIGYGKDYGSQSAGMDMNWFNGTYAKLLEFCNKSEVVIPPVPEPSAPPAPGALFKAECIAGQLNIRDGAGLAFKATGKFLTKGQIVDVYEVKNNWFKIAEGQWVSGYPSYMKKLTTPVPPPVVPPVVPPPVTPPPSGDYLFQGKVVTPYTYLPVREGPGTGFKEIGERKPGDMLNILEANKDRWYRIGDKEWVWGRHIQSTTPPLTTLAYPLEKKFPISQKFGVNSSTYGAARGHNGVDYASYGGTKLIASADGFVETREDNTTYGYGRHIRIRVQGGVLIYGHMKTIYPKLGEKVKKGDVIGLSDGAVGEPYAGFSTGNHLHFEYRIDREPNPLKGGNYTYWAIDTLPITEEPK